MSNPHEDFSSSAIKSKRTLEFESSSLDSYSTVFNKEFNNFSTSSEFSLIKFDHEDLEENSLSTPERNRTFIKEISTTIINAFTGKPISPNPWGKLCSKPLPHQSELDVIPIQCFSPNPVKSTSQRQSNDKKPTRSSRKDEIDYEQVENEAFEHDQSVEVKYQKNTPLQRRRKKRSSLKDSIDNSSTSSEERVQTLPIDLHPKVNRSIENDSSWYRLADVYTSDSSDENNHLLKPNISYSIRLKAEVYTPDQSFSSTSVNTRPTVTTENCSTVFNFLESLSERIPLENKHPNAKSYFLQSGFNGKEKRQELANELLSIFNKDVFSSQLSDKVSVVWSGRLTATAGHCTSRRNTRTAVITLSHKVCDTPERCRDTLLHEMCHAAVTLIDGVMEQGHGSLWRQWTRKAEQSYPYLPAISVRHTYDVVYKFIYRCIKCQYQVLRHSKSLNLVLDLCGKCMGEFQLIVNNDKDDLTKQERQTPKRTINKYNLYVKENFHITKEAHPHLSTPQLLRQLSEEYKKNKESQEQLQLPDLEQLRI